MQWAKHPQLMLTAGHGEESRKFFYINEVQMKIRIRLSLAWLQDDAVKVDAQGFSFSILLGFPSLPTKLDLLVSLTCFFLFLVYIVFW